MLLDEVRLTNLGMQISRDQNVMRLQVPVHDLMVYERCMSDEEW
jgi:hypothetical protein